MKVLVLATLVLLSSGCGNYSEVKAPPSNPDQSMLSQPEGDTEEQEWFEALKRDIFQPHCIQCHTGRHRAYENYSVVKLAAPQILERVLSQDPSLRMPKNAAPLSQDLKDRLKEWVAAGAPEFRESETPQSGEGPKPTAGVSFLEIKQKILKPYNCTKCHSQYNNYEPTKKSLGTIVSLVNDNKMPFPARKGAEVVPVPPQLKDLLIQWVGEGAPEYAGQSTALNRPSQLQPNWISIRDHVIGPKCVLCHNSFGPRGPTFMGTYRELRDWFAASPKLFNFSEPEKSHFIGSMLGRVNEEDGEFFYDPMPLNSEFDDVLTAIDGVSDKNIEVIKKWIELKLPYDEEDQ